MSNHDDLTVIDCGWNPPKHWAFGVCQGCGERFKPKLPKQFWCAECRNREHNTAIQCGTPQSEVTSNTLIMRLAYSKGINTRKELSIVLGVASQDLRQVVQCKFVSPKNYPVVRKVKKFFNLRLEQLFPLALPTQLASYKKWEADFEP
jgi:hypothetical protein